MKLSLYMVVGHCGRYEDCYQWTAAVCLTKDTAAALIEKFGAFLIEHGLTSTVVNEVGEIETQAVHVNFVRYASEQERATWPDPLLHTDETGTSYKLEELQISATSRAEVDAFGDALLAFREALPR